MKVIHKWFDISMCNFILSQAIFFIIVNLFCERLIHLRFVQKRFMFFFLALLILIKKLTSSADHTLDLVFSVELHENIHFLLLFS